MINLIVKGHYHYLQVRLHDVSKTDYESQVDKKSICDSVTTLTIVISKKLTT